MKKNFLAAAFLGVSMSTFNAFAQTPQSTCPDTCEPQTCQTENCIVPPGGRLKNFDPFIGTTLTDTQKSKLADLNKQRAEKTKAKKTEQSKERQAMDSIRRADKVNYLHSVRDIVGPENYVIFLENIAIDQPQRMGANPGKPGMNQQKFTKGDNQRKRGDMKKGDRPNGKRHDAPKQADKK